MPCIDYANLNQDVLRMNTNPNNPEANATFVLFSEDLLLLMAADRKEEQNNALLTMALYLFL